LFSCSSFGSTVRKLVGAILGFIAVPIGVFGSILTLTFLPDITNNIYAQIGLITLIGAGRKNAILIVEYAKERVDRGMGLLESTIAAVSLRLRPIVMTSWHLCWVCYHWLLQAALLLNHAKQSGGLYLEEC
jgi:multidrug efflux pump subunit AcrB